MQVIDREQLYVRPTEFIAHGSTLPVGITTDAVQSATPLSVVLKQVYMYTHVAIAV